METYSPVLSLLLLKGGKNIKNVVTFEKSLFYVNNISEKLIISFIDATTTQLIKKNCNVFVRILMEQKV